VGGFGGGGGGGEINEKLLKKAEIVKANEYCKLGYAMFTHFGYLYATSSDRIESHYFNHLESMALSEVVKVYCQEPDESKFFLFELFMFCWITDSVFFRSFPFLF
jgi:hypothetical protein